MRTMRHLPAGSSLNHKAGMTPPPVAPAIFEEFIRGQINPIAGQGLQLGELTPYPLAHIAGLQYGKPAVT